MLMGSASCCWPARTWRSGLASRCWPSRHAQYSLRLPRPASRRPTGH